MSAATTTGTRGRRSVLFWVLLALALLAVALAAGAPPDDGAPLDPRATGPLGAKGIVLTLEELGGDVSITARMGNDFDTALVLRDDLTEAQREEVTDWIGAGGTLLIADPGSSLHPGTIVGDTQTVFGDATLPRDDCTIPPLEELDRIDPSGGVLYDRDDGTQVCFTRGDGAFVIAVPQGAGWVVATGGAGTFVNARLASEDNAALAANVLVPEPGTRVAVLEPRDGRSSGRRPFPRRPRPRQREGSPRPAAHRVRALRVVEGETPWPPCGRDSARADRRLRARRGGGQPDAEGGATRGSGKPAARRPPT